MCFIIHRVRNSTLLAVIYIDDVLGDRFGLGQNVLLPYIRICTDFGILQEPGCNLFQYRSMLRSSLWASAEPLPSRSLYALLFLWPLPCCTSNKNSFRCNMFSTVLYLINAFLYLQNIEGDLREARADCFSLRRRLLLWLGGHNMRRLYKCLRITDEIGAQAHLNVW